MLSRRLGFLAGALLGILICACDKGKSGDTDESSGYSEGGGGGGGSGSTGDAGSPSCDYGAGSAEVSAESDAPEMHTPWDWSGVVGTGQSLAVGDHGGWPVNAPAPLFDNLQLSTGETAWPVDPNDASLEMVSLDEPIGRRAPSYPSSWPENISGVTIHTSMADEVTALVRNASDREYVGVHGQFGENGQCMTLLQKEPVLPTPGDSGEEVINGRAFEATLIATEAVTRLAAAEGKTYGVGAITVVHGECDAGNSGYEDDLVQLWSDYNTDLKAITGQAEAIEMLVSQQNSTTDRSASTLAQWQVGVNHPEDIACVGPTYQYESPDGTHLDSDGYRQLGEKFGQVYFERVVAGRDWQPLQPANVERRGRVIAVEFHVPVRPLVWDDALEAAHQSLAAWANGKGFEVRAGSTKVTISSVKIVCDTVEITVASDLPKSGLTVSYALYADPDRRSVPVGGTARWGLLRDSDPFVGTTTGMAQPNFALAFELEVP